MRLVDNFEKMRAIICYSNNYMLNIIGTISLSVTQVLKIVNMYYIIVTQSESTGEKSCKIKGLTHSETEILVSRCKDRQITYIKDKDFFEADFEGAEGINTMCGVLGYKILSQSMAIEDTYIGGRKIQVQKLIWTMYK